MPCPSPTGKVIEMWAETLESPRYWRVLKNPIRWPPDLWSAAAMLPLFKAPRFGGAHSKMNAQCRRSRSMTAFSTHRSGGGTDRERLSQEFRLHVTPEKAGVHCLSMDSSRYSDSQKFVPFGVNPWLAYVLVRHRRLSWQMRTSATHKSKKTAAIGTLF